MILIPLVYFLSTTHLVGKHKIKGCMVRYFHSRKILSQGMQPWFRH